jgi:hypothetical protein
MAEHPEVPLPRLSFAKDPASNNFPGGTRPCSCRYGVPAGGSRATAARLSCATAAFVRLGGTNNREVTYSVGWGPWYISVHIYIVGYWIQSA